jgi:hypothetical protein
MTHAVFEAVRHLPQWARIEVEAMFMPRRTGDLQKGASELIGQRFTFVSCGTIDFGKFEGQSQWIFPDEVLEKVEFFWVPEEDLADITSVRRVR